MNSFNHYAYGAVGDWMYTVMAGIDIDPAAPAYKHIRIQPQPGGGFTQASASHMTPYGRVSSAWSIINGKLELNVDVPSNTTATVRLPGAQLAAVSEHGKKLARGAGITDVRQDGSTTVVETGSGHYVFNYPYTMPAVGRADVGLRSAVAAR
jgi:alpha-L-rhamnosidase